MELKVKRALDLKDLHELELCLDVVDVLKNYSIDSLVLFTRRHELFDALIRAQDENHLNGSDEESAEKTMLFMRCEEEMEYALSRAGYFRNDFGSYHVSFNILAFLRILAEGRYDDSFFNEFENANREWKSFSNAEYESFEGLSNIQVYAFKAILREILSERQYKVISLRMGSTMDLAQAEKKLLKILIFPR